MKKFNITREECKKNSTNKKYLLEIFTREGQMLKFVDIAVENRYGFDTHMCVRNAVADNCRDWLGNPILHVKSYMQGMFDADVVEQTIFMIRYNDITNFSMEYYIRRKKRILHIYLETEEEECCFFIEV